MRLHDTLDYSAREAPDADFAFFQGRRMTYREAVATANRMANALVASGLGQGDRFAVLSKNSIELALLYYAGSKAGAVPVPLNYRLAAPEWAYIVRDAGARVLLAQEALAIALEPARDELPAVKRFVALDGAPAGYEPLAVFLAGQSGRAPERDIAEADDAYQMYTSGTTGRPKGAVLTHRAVTAQLHQALLGFGARPGERALIVAPMYHAAAAITTFATVQMGGALWIQDDFVPAEVVKALSEDRIAFAMLVPAMIQFCLVAVPDVAERRYDDLRLIIYGASPISEPTLRRAIEVFGCDFLQGYGMTETTAAATYLMPADHRRALAGEPRLLLSAGRPLLGTELRIVDESDRPVPVGSIGEVAVRGPQLMSGYWNLPEPSAEALRGGWMHTGDAGVLDDEGFLFIQDRVKDMIVSGGENVYPREVEDVLFQHEAVADVAVIGVPDERWGETVKAIVVLKAGASATPELLLDFCKGRLGGYKRPRSVEFVVELPRNPSGKVMKKDLREKYWAGHSRRVG
ncbi:MAG: long-chain-fatty-acid--CoA ligase [Myxococcota bacterium]